MPNKAPVGIFASAEIDPAYATLAAPPLREHRLRELRRFGHVGDVDGDGHVAVQAAVTRPHRQFVAGRPRLVVLARALVRQGARP